MIWIDADTAVKLFVNSDPMMNVDGLTIDETIAYNESGMELIWHFQTPGGITSSTVITPTTSGVYDWLHSDGGIYTMELPASGGASVDNDTEGFGFFTGKADAVLPWRSPTYGFRAAALNNALVEDAYSVTRGLSGTALPDAAADAAGGLAISDVGGLDIDALDTAVTAILAQLAEVDNDGTAISHSGAMKLVLSIITGITNGGGTSTLNFRNLLNTKNRLTFTVDADGNRLSTDTRDAT